MKRFGKRWGRPSKAAVQLLLAAVMVVALLAAAIPASGVAAEGDTGSMKFTLNAGEYEITKDENGLDVIYMEGFPSAVSSGDPMLPHKVYNILVPPDVIWPSLELKIISAETRTLEGTYDIKPAAPDVTWVDGEWIEDWGEGKDIIDGRNINVYENDASFPEDSLDLLPYSQMRKWKFTKVDFAPFQYNPISKELTLIESVVIELSYSQSPAELDPGLMRDTVMDDVAPQMLFNYEQARDWYRTVAEKSSVTYDYVIITTNAIETNSTNLSTFIAHKQGLGHSVLVVTYEDDIDGLTGQSPNHRAERIRQWLKNNYSAMGIEYVLLIGDPHPYESGEGDIPMKMCWPRRTSADHREAPTDYFYADLTGNWDYDGDQYYGEWSHDFGPAGGVDFTAEVYVGRIPVYGADYTTLDNILQKIIDYETEPTSSEAAGDISWRESILMPMGFQAPGYDGAMLAEQMKDDYLAPVTYDSWRMYQQGSGACSLNSIYTSEEELTGGTVVRDRWAGTDYGIVAWWAHGSSNNASVGYDGCWDGTLMNSTYTSSLDDDHPAFTYQCSCTNGYPESSNNLQYAILEQGGIGTVSATRASWFNTLVDYGEFDGSTTNSGIGYEYVKRLVQGLPAGDALYETKESMSPEKATRLMNWYDFNLYGDPTTSIESAGAPPLEPDIWVSPPSFEVMLAPNTVWSDTLYIGNNGSGTLTYSITDAETTSSDCPWLDENPKSGSVEPGNYDWITVSIDTTGLAPRAYYADIIIANDDPDENPTIVPVQLIVKMWPNIWVEPPSFDVTLPPDTTWSGKLDIGNTGEGTLNYSMTDVETTGGPCFKWAAQDPDPLPAGAPGLLMAKVSDPDGLADIDYVKNWVTQRPFDTGYLYDDGTHGDETAGDGVYTCTIGGTTYYGPEFGVILEAKDLAGHTTHISITAHIDIASASDTEGMLGFNQGLEIVNETESPADPPGAKRVASGEIPAAMGDVIHDIPSPSDTPNGLAWDGTYLWSTGLDTDTIYKISPVDGSIISSIPAPGATSPSDLAWDGTYLWHSDFGTGMIYQLDPTTGAVVDQFATPASGSEGLAFDGEYLWVGSYATSTIYKLDTTGAVVDQFAAPGSASGADGLAWDGLHLWICGYDKVIYECNTSGAVITTFTAPGSDPNGLAYDGAYLWNDDGTESLIRQIDVEVTPCPWLDENPKSGAVAPANYDEIAVSIDTTGLAVGSYCAEIIITNNDPDENPTIVPVQLTVKAAIDVGNVLFDETHSPSGGAPGYYTIEDIFADWAELLESWGFTVDSATVGPITYDLLKDYCAVVIPEPTVDYSDAEVEAIAAYVNDGGGLLILGEWGPFATQQGIFPVVNELAAPFGMSFNDDTVYDEVHNDGGTGWPLIPDFDSSVAGGDVDVVAEYATCSIGTQGAAYPIAWAYPSAYTTDAAAEVAGILNGSGAGTAAAGGQQNAGGNVAPPNPGKTGDAAPQAGSGLVVGEESGITVADSPSSGYIDGFNVTGTVSDGLSYAVQWFALQYTPALSYNLKRVEVIAGEATGKVTIQLRPDDGGLPSSTVLREASFDQVPPVSWQGAEFASSYPLAAGTTYWIVIKVVIGSQASIATSGDLITYVHSPDGSSWSTYWTFEWMARFYGEGIPVMAASSYGDGRAVVIGDGNLFDNNDHDGDGVMALYEYDNEKLAVNIIDWLCQPPEKKPDLVIARKGEEPSPPQKYLHPEREPLDPRKPIEEPVCTDWHELYPVYSNLYHLSDWKDNGDGVLSPCDNIILTNNKTGEQAWYHVDQMTVTIFVTPEKEGASVEAVALEFVGGYEQVRRAIEEPVSTYWHTVYPEFCRDYHIVDWKDTEPKGLSFCDSILLVDVETGERMAFHVDEVTWDIIVSPTKVEPPNTYLVWYTILNRGTATAEAGHSATLYVDKNEVEHKVVPVALGPGESYTDVFRTVVECTPPEDTIVVCADNYKQVDELNEKNNCLRNVWECICQPSIEVQKTVWDREAGEWVEEVKASIGEIVRFRCEIHNNGSCCELTDIAATDVLSESLEYADNATVDGKPWEPVQVGPNEYQWDLEGMTLEPCNTITIEFDAEVVSCGVDVNLQSAEGWCGEARVYDEDTATVIVPPEPSVDVEKKVWDPYAGKWVEEICAPIDGTVTFQCTIHNDGNCCDLTDIVVTDELSASLEYVDNAWLQAPGYAGRQMYLHPEKPIDPLEPITEPVCTDWHELYPMYCNWYHLSEWEDNGDKVLSPSDQVGLTDKQTGEEAWYHVDEVTITLFVSFEKEEMAIEFDGGYELIEKAMYRPVSTYWHEVWPEFMPPERRDLHLAEWDDNGDRFLSVSDYILLMRKEAAMWWHVDEVTVDIIVSPKWIPIDPPDKIVPDHPEPGMTTIYWRIENWLPGVVLEPCQTITIQFDAEVAKWSKVPDINLQRAEAWCDEAGAWVSDEDTAAVQPFIPGDANMDGVVDVFDLVKVKRIILGLDPPTCGADANLDGEIDVFDLVKIKRIILGIDP